MELNFKGKTALVTGEAAGIGRELLQSDLHNTVPR